MSKFLLKFLRFFSDLFHHLIDSKHHIYHHNWISRKNLQFRHILIEYYLTLFLKGLKCSYQQVFLTKLRHLLHPRTLFSYFLSTLFFSFCSSFLDFNSSFNKNKASSFKFPMVIFWGIYSASIINKMLCLSTVSNIPDGNEAIGSLDN